MNAETLTAPFPYFGGKRRVAPEVWRRLGRVDNYVEPFAGSLAVLLARPGGAHGRETINDLDGYVCNFWRAVAADPGAVARAAGRPVHELDTNAWHAKLRDERETFTAWLRADPAHYDAEKAGAWAWGLSTWIGAGWATSPSGQMPNLDGAGAKGTLSVGRDLARVLPRLAARLATVRCASGDFERLLSPTVLRPRPGYRDAAGFAGLFLDPPYDEEEAVYSASASVWHRVTAWCEVNGENPRYRIALCGYEGTWTPPETWTEHAWKARGGYANASGDNANARRERVWFSPACLCPQPSLFG